MDIGLINAAIEELDLVPKFPSHQTVGDRIGLSLNIPEDIEAVIQKVTNYAHPIYRVVINSRFPYRSILYSQIRNADSLKAGQFNNNVNLWKSYKWTPPKDLRSFDSPLSNKSIIMFADLAVETYLDPTLYECKSVGGKVRLEEFSIYDFKSGMLDDRRKIFAKERLRVKGQETRNSKLIKASIVDRKHVLFHFLSEPTFEFRVPTVDPDTLKISKTDNVYDVEIQMQDLIPFLDEKELDFNQLTLKKFKEILQVVDVKMWCSCPMQSWGPYNAELSKINASTRPTNIPATQWNKIYVKNQWGSVGYGCKHLGAIFKNISIFESVMLGKLRELQREK